MSLKLYFIVLFSALSFACADLKFAQNLPKSLKYYETLDSSSLSHNLVKRGADPTR